MATINPVFLTLSKAKRRAVLPGFGLTMGYTLLYLSLIVLIPLSTIFFKTFTLSWPTFWRDISDPQVVASYKLTFGASLAGALVNVVFGLLVAWVLTRYSFPMRRVIDGLVDLPFALPTAVAGITLTALYDQNGWIGHALTADGWIGKALCRLSYHGSSLFPDGLRVAYTPLGVTIALIFIGLPFVVRTVQPVMQDLDVYVEEAASSLGATRWQTFTRVIMPTLAPALLTGFSLAFARALGEYGSVVFISGNKPFETEIVPVHIMSKLEQFDYAGATAIAVVMLAASFVMLLVINMIQLRASRRFSAA